MNTKLISVVVVVILAGVGIAAVAMKDETSAPPMSSDAMMDMPSESMTSQTQPAAMNGILETNKVTYKGFAVVEKTIKVKKGTTVTWTNEDSAKHDVTPVNETADFKATDLFGKGESRSITFNTVGTFEYICSPHPYMKGTVEVVE